MARGPLSSTVRRRRRRAALIMGTWLAAGALAACGGSSGGSPASPGVDAKAPLHSELPGPLKEAGKVVVLSDIPSAPFEMFVSDDSKEVTGLDYDLAQALSAQLGVPFVFKQTPFNGIIPALQAKQGDLIISQMSSTPERQKVLDFVEYFNDGTGILVLKGNPDGVKGRSDLCGRSVAVQSGTLQVEFVEKENTACADGGRPAIKVSTLPSIPTTQLALSSGKVAAVVGPTASMAYAALTAEKGTKYEVLSIPGEPAGYESQPGGIGILRADKEMTAAVQKALQAIIDDGTYAEILDTYGLSSVAVESATIASAD